MSNIYQIEQDLLSIFNAIEENEGEITSELEEQLNIKQDEFKDKIEAYTAVIKQLELDITGIKAEKCRLNDFQKSKEKTIDRLKQIMINAIQMFGDVSKSGARFVDFGTGKVSLRHSDSIEVDEDGTKQFVNRFFGYFNWLKYTNTFDQIELDAKEIAKYCNTTRQDDEEESVVTEYTEDDIANLQADLGLRIKLEDVIATPQGRNLVKAMMEYTSAINTKPVIDKTAIKKEFKATGVIPTFSNYVSKDNLVIK